MMLKQTLPIAYVMQSFPTLTQTFVYREVLALKDRGFDVATFAIWKPDEDKLSQESRHFVDCSSYVFPISWSEFLRAHLYFLLTRPARYIGTLLFVLTRNGECSRNRLRAFFHFCEAVYLAPKVKKLGVRHMHAHFTINAASIALVLSRLLGISFSFTAHNIFFTDRLILREKIREAHFIVAISEFTRRLLTSFVPGEKLDSKIHIVHCGLSPDSFRPRDSRSESDVPVLLFVGQLVERKGASILVEACRLLAEQGVTFRCIIVGGGPQETFLRQLVEQYDLGSAVEFAGAVFQEHLKEYLNQADIFVLPCITAENGDMDGIPVSLMEAMAMEIPSVSTYVSGIPELIEDGESGLLVQEQDGEALSRALGRLLEDRELCMKLGQNGRQRVSSEFNIDQNAAQLAGLFERYLSYEQ